MRLFFQFWISTNRATYEPSLFFSLREGCWRDARLTIKICWACRLKESFGCPICIISAADFPMFLGLRRQPYSLKYCCEIGEGARVPAAVRLSVPASKDE